MTDSLLEKVILAIETELLARNEERRADELPLLRKGVVTILGQFSLFADETANKRLHLTATMDLDATLSGNPSLRGIVISCLKQFSLRYDDLSSEIWIPPESTFHVLHDTDLLQVRALDALFALTCKAVKAPAKNRFLIQEALQVYGMALRELIERHGGDVDYFTRAHNED